MIDQKMIIHHMMSYDDYKPLRSKNQEGLGLDITIKSSQTMMSYCADIYSQLI